MTHQEGEAVQPSTAVVHWWGKGVFFFLVASILLLGIGRLELPLVRTGFSAWSISRTTFFFWLIWKIVICSPYGRGVIGFKKGWFPLPLLIFFAAVTLSLLPDFHEAADYRYFFFAVMHCVMVMDIFGSGDRPKFLLLLLGALPGVLVIRGIVHDPSVLDFGQMNRFAYPLAHANPAGLLFSMSIPLALAIILTEKGLFRGTTLGSLTAQFVGLVLTYSRGAWLASIISLFGLSLMEHRLRKVVLAFGVTALIAFVTITPLRNRLLSVLTPSQDVAIEGRLRFMTDALTVGLEKPFFGVGYGRDRLREGVRRDVPGAEQFGFIPHSHNVYTELLAETGFVGLSAFLWMVVSNVTRLIRKAQSDLAARDRIRYLCLATSLVAFLIGGLGDVPFYNHETRIFFFTLLALSYIVLRNDIVSQSITNAALIKPGNTLAQVTRSDMPNSLVSIILFAHAPYARFLHDSLGSILTQSYRLLDVNVLSDGSEEVRNAVAEFSRDSRVAVVSQGTQPFLQAANEIMKEAKGDYLATWNSDDIYREDHVKLLVDALEQNPALGAAFDNTEFFKNVSGDLNRQNGTLSLGLIVSQDEAEKLAGSCLTVQDIVRENFMTGPSSLIRKSAFEIVGGYDKDIYLNCDLHWFYRLAAYFPVAFVDYVGVRKRVHALNNTAVNPHYEYGLRELEHIRERYPEVYDRIGKSTFNKKLGRKYFRLGLYYERRGEPDKARAAYKQAMLLRKWSLRYSWEYCRSSAMAHLRKP